MKQNLTDQQNPPLARQWVKLGINSDEFAKKTRWLAHPRNLNKHCSSHFRLSAELFKLSRRDYVFAATAFLEAIIGLERAMRLHFKAPAESYGIGSYGCGDAFRNLFERTVQSGLIPNDVFRTPAKYRRDLLDRSKPEPTSHGEALSQIVPRIRNDYVHGKPIVLCEFFSLAVDLRVIADQMTTRQNDGATTSHHLPGTLATSTPASRTPKFD